MINILVQDRIDVSTTSLEKQSDGAIAEIVLNDGGSKSRQVCGISAIWDPLDRMTGELVDNGQSLPIFLIQSKDADLRINRAHLGDLLVRRKRIGMAHVHFLAILQLEPAVFHDSVFMADADS